MGADDSVREGGDPTWWSWTRWTKGVRVEYGALMHSCVVVLLTFGIILTEIPDFRFWDWNETWFQQPVSLTTRLTCGFGVIYFAVDSILLLGVKTLSKHLRYGFVVHHICCALALIGPILYGRDGAIVIIGYLLGEISNPPRVFAQLFRVVGDKQRSEQCDLAHYSLFIAVRALSAKLAFSAFLPSAELWTTQLCIIFLIFFTILTLWHYFWPGSGGPTKPAAGNLKQD